MCCVLCDVLCDGVACLCVCVCMDVHVCVCVCVCLCLCMDVHVCVEISFVTVGAIALHQLYFYLLINLFIRMCMVGWWSPVVVGHFVLYLLWHLLSEIEVG